MTTLRLPPGSTGLPLLGETLVFLKDIFAFVERGVTAHGPVFRTNVLGRNTAVIVGPDACAAWIDPAKVEREGAMPPHVKAFFAGDTLPSLDGEAHRKRKELVLAGFTKDALATYLPGMQALITRFLSTWAEKQDFAWIPELKALAIEGICSNVMGMSAGPTMDRLLVDYADIGPGLGGLPIPLPGTAYSRAKAALGRILATFEDVVREHRKTPTDDGLSRMLAKVTSDGTRLSDDDARRELHHVVIAGLILWAELANAARRLQDHPEIREALTSEIRASAGDGPVSLDVLLTMPLLRRVVMEMKRTCPIVPAQFGRAKEAFELGGFTIPKGWMVLWGVHSTNRSPSIYAEPDRFDPARFDDVRKEHEKHAHAFVPQGPGAPEGHRCPGLDYSTCFISMFLVELLRGPWKWTLGPAEPFRWNMIPPEPTEGLRVTFARS